MVVYLYKKGRQTMKNIITTIAMFILTITVQAQFLTNNSFFKMFQDSINMYRNSLGLTNVVLEPKYKNFVDQHSYYQSRLGYTTHGKGNFTFQKRVEKEINLKNISCYENCGECWVTEFNNIGFGVFTILDGFIKSPSHNKSLIEPTNTKFYISCYKKDDTVYFTLLLSE
jgi:uncharacterized protein YkwD